MAAQRSKHTELQMSGFYAYHQSKQCPSCGQHKFKVTESRKTFDGTRRRYRCESCDFKQTMYEIPSECYEELRMLRSKFALIRDAVLEAAPAPLKPTVEPSIPAEILEIPCCDCTHLTPNGCTFDIPEALTEDAKGCNLFQALV